MAALKEPVKIFIVQSLACFETPQQVADSVEETYKIKIDRKQCHSYDPTKYAGRNLSKKLKDLFYETRKKFQENILDIPIANKAFRLGEKPMQWFEPKNDGRLLLRKEGSSQELEVDQIFKFFLMHMVFGRSSKRIKSIGLICVTHL